MENIAPSKHGIKHLGYGHGSTSFLSLINGAVYEFVAPQGAFAGLQAGYNFQADSFVVGAEIDASWSNVNGGFYFEEYPLEPWHPVRTTDLHWLVSGRLRAGLASDRALFYITGGVSYGRVSNYLELNMVTSHSTEPGWIAGFGMEYALSKSWSARMEYLHTDLDDYQLLGVAEDLSHSNSSDLFRIAASYHFGREEISDFVDGVGYNWTAFYVGVHGGHAVGGSHEKHGVYASGDWAAQGNFGGIQGGFTYQLDRAVVGFEVDYSQTDFYGFYPYDQPTNDRTTKVDWFATGRVRAGMAFDRGLLYVSAGFATGEATNKYGTSFYHDRTTGWTAGLGMEYALSHHWSVKTEYAYIDLGEVQGFDGFVTHRFDNTFSTFRTGLNYRF